LISNAKCRFEWTLLANRKSRELWPAKYTATTEEFNLQSFYWANLVPSVTRMAEPRSTSCSQKDPLRRHLTKNKALSGGIEFFDLTASFTRQTKWAALFCLTRRRDDATKA